MSGIENKQMQMCGIISFSIPSSSVFRSLSERLRYVARLVPSVKCRLSSIHCRNHPGTGVPPWLPDGVSAPAPPSNTRPFFFFFFRATTTGLCP